MIGLFGMLLSATAAPTMADVLRLAPKTAGDLVLHGQEHRPIERIAVAQSTGLNPPGLAELELVEQPVLEAGGCSRKRWVAAFRHGPDVAREAGTLAGTRNTVEIALPRSGRCPGGRYVHVNRGITPPAAFDALSRLDRVRSGRQRVRFVCSDDTSSDLCTSDATIRLGLARAAPWAVSLRARVIVLWLGIPGRIVTEVRLDPTRTDVVTVARKIPSPA